MFEESNLYFAMFFETVFGVDYKISISIFLTYLV